MSHETQPNSQPAGPTRYRAILGNNELVALLSARLLSGVGDQAARAVLALYVLDESQGDALLAALVLAVSYVPSTFGFAVLGSLADRYPRRTVMLVSDVARAVLIGMLALAVSFDSRLAVVLALLLAAELFSAPALSARSSLMPDAARTPAEYQAVVGLGSTFEQGVQVLGFVVGGVAVGLTSASFALLFDAVTFLISFLLVLGFVAHRAPAAAPGTSLRRIGHDFKGGLRTVMKTPSIRAVVLLLWATAALLVATDAVALPYAASMSAAPWAATALLAATPAGAAVGALLVARLPIGRQIRLVFPLAIASTLPMLATAMEPPLVVAAALWFITGLCQGYVVTLMALSMQLTPEQRRGRVFGIAGSGFNGMAIVGLVGLGAVATATTPAAALVLAGALGLLVIALAALFWPRSDVRSAVRVSYGATTRSL
ncbi:MAG TPA: MFS transporter [Actinomycetes bacterium]|nr:MFS transporter [Actinomycetes bacterium]